MSVIKEIYDIIKDLRDMSKKYKDEKMSEKVVEIQERFFDFRDEMETLKEENNELRRSLKDFQNASKLEKDLILTEKGFYILKSDEEQKKKIMYCAACWQNYKKLMPYVHTIGTAMQCSNCHGLIQ